MKTIIIVIFISFLSPNIFSQVSPEDLDHSNYGVRFNALKIMVKEKRVDFIPEIKARLFEQPDLTMQFAFLDALAKLYDPEVEQLTLSFIQQSDNFQYSEDPLFYKVQATEILFDLNNYSTIQYVFDLLNRDQNRVDPIAIVLLKRIMLELPGQYQNALSEIVRIFNNVQIPGMFRLIALEVLEEVNYSEIIELSLFAAINDPDPEIRFKSNRVLGARKYQGLHELYTQQLSVEPEAYIRSTYATSLLILFGEPADLKLVIDYQPGEPDITSREFVAAAIENFIPLKPDTLNWQGMITKLLSYTDELFLFGWIKNEETRDYYIRKLNAVKEAIENNNATAEACTIINDKLLPKAEQDLKGELITTEGYKFLHYYTIYVKEEIEKEYGLCD